MKVTQWWNGLGSDRNWIVLAVIIVIIGIVTFLIKNQQQTDFTTGEGKRQLVQSQTSSVYQVTRPDGKIDYELQISVDNSKTVKMPIVFRHNGVDGPLSDGQKSEAIDRWLKLRAISAAQLSIIPPPEQQLPPFMAINYEGK